MLGWLLCNRLVKSFTENFLKKPHTNGASNIYFLFISCMYFSIAIVIEGVPGAGA